MLICKADFIDKLGVLVLDVREQKHEVLKYLASGTVGLTNTNALERAKRAMETTKGGTLGCSELKRELRLAEFFRENEELVCGHGNLKRWVDRLTDCQAADGHYCDKNLATHKTAKGDYVRLCWHHDNQADDPKLADKMNIETIGALNTVAASVASIEKTLGVKCLTVPELCWWSVRTGVHSKLPKFIIETQFKQEATSVKVFMGKKDTDARYMPQVSPTERMERVAVPVQRLEVDEDPALGYMRNPKPLHPDMPKYLSFVRTLSSCQSGKKGTTHDPIVAHHLIGHGESVMGAKANDLFTMPLLMSEHELFHRDPKGWERQHGSQLTHVKNTIKKAVELGALSLG